MPKIKKEDILKYHNGPAAGKIEVAPSKPVRTKKQLSLAYTPGVAQVSLEIKEHPEKSWDYTFKGNTVAILTDGSRVLGLGDIGPAAALPVMEGKAMLFKILGDVNAVPICIKTDGTQEIVETMKRLEPTFGAVNIEDIKPPRCFEVLEGLRERLAIPVFHDDQHGTAIVVLAALL
ncbi:MAG: NADP-dependent malic enzyme, partial [Candidatus Aenigmarchaeota archaeon]|nr:NADP-dependent malic enzyme [Candidatus Aenigmarchaeota archaeon]